MSTLEEDLKAAAAARDWPTYFRQLRAEKDAQAKAKEELVAPAPEHTSRDPWPEGFKVPGAAASLVKLAEGLGWLAEVRYARGSVVCRRKGRRLIERRHSVVVRLWWPRVDFHAVVSWESQVDVEKLSWKVDVAQCWPAGRVPQEVGVMALKDLMRGAES